MNGPVRFILCGALTFLRAEEPARIQVFTAVPGTVRRGDSVTLAWSATGTDRVRLDPLGVDFPPTGSLSHPLVGRTIFWLHASNPSGGQSRPVVVDVIPEDRPPASPIHPVTPTPLPSPPPSPLPSPGAVWIQFAALASPVGVQRLREDLRRTAGIETVVSDVPDPQDPRRTLRRVRLGPFVSDREAKARLRDLKPRLAALALKPYVERPPGKAASPP
ncbi:SPOR domain-containing protein [Mesoterricola silvestris]|uniref:SPOR domain-containing protein n=1 Tax=Mesoterricola silvestris TaxID=2927979 RepID=A0AA48GNA9_9BACT|nr:SPOR domain-containing protein [Mesoterricola silvestris]BDU73019.1 hypothetical protein METEAL_21930 [Mesoterricola silvestris]